MYNLDIAGKNLWVFPVSSSVSMDIVVVKKQQQPGLALQTSGLNPNTGTDTDIWSTKQIQIVALCYKSIIILFFSYGVILYVYGTFYSSAVHSYVIFTKTILTRCIKELKEVLGYLSGILLD